MTETILSKYPVGSQGVTLAYLLAFILPLTFFYSPKIEKSNLVLLTRTLTITQERNTPAYSLYQQTQKIQNNLRDTNLDRLKRLAQTQVAVDLNASPIQPLEIQQQPVHEIKIESEIKIEKAELNKATTQKLNALLQRQPDSTLASAPMNMQIPENSAVVRGHFELKDGVGLVDQIVVLKRMLEGQTLEIGQVDLKAGQYQIAVGSFEGEIIAEIKDRAGIIIGEVRERLVNLKRVGQYYEGPLLKVGRPSAFGFNAQSIDQRKINENTVHASFFSGNYDLKKTDDSYPNVSRHSSTLGLIKDDSKKIATTISVRTSADKTETHLFSKPWVDGAKVYLSEQLQIQYIQESGVVIGRVMLDGKPLAGAQVVVENQPGLEPYYLDQFLIPQTKQTQSSDNGFFIIPGLNPGSYEISSFLGDRYLGTQQYMVETDLVAYQEIYSSTAPRSIVARSFDAFTSENISSEILVPGYKDILSLENGSTRFKENSSFGLTEIINRPTAQEYAAYVYIRNHNQDHLHLPQVKDAFLEYVVSQLQISKIPDTSIFIGFTPNNNFEVHVADSEFSKNNLAFFDSQGNITTRQIAGGGFIAFNMPEGLQEIILQDEKTDRSYSTVFYSKASYLYVSHFSE